MPAVLLVTRTFAPTSHVSGERAIKLAKYLPDFGWKPTVLTGIRATPGLPEDPGLLEQVEHVDVIRTRVPEFAMFYGGQGKRGGGGSASRGAPRRGAWHPKSWLVPDSQVLWYPFAVRSAMRGARTRTWDAVIATSFPPTAILIAHAVASKLRIPYVADFRDSWTGFHSAPERPAWLASLERRLEGRMIRGAAAVVAVDTAIVAQALARIPQRERPPLHEIQNGYDESDFTGVEPAQLPPFSLVHTGQLRRPPEPLWRALAHTLEQCPELHGRLHFWQIGFVDSRAEAMLSAPPPGVTVHRVPPVPQREAIAYMLGADLLLVEEFGSVMPSKTLQYLRADRPILGLTDAGGLMEEFLAAMPETLLARRDDPVEAGRLVAEVLARPRGRPAGRAGMVAHYSRREIARRFATILDAARTAQALP